MYSFRCKRGIIKLKLKLNQNRAAKKRGDFRWFWRLGLYDAYTINMLQFSDGWDGIILVFYIATHVPLSGILN